MSFCRYTIQGDYSCKTREDTKWNKKKIKENFGGFGPPSSSSSNYNYYNPKGTCTLKIDLYKRHGGKIRTITNLKMQNTTRNECNAKEKSYKQSYTRYYGSNNDYVHVTKTFI